MQADAGGPPFGQHHRYAFGGTEQHGACRSHLIHFDESPTLLQGKIDEAQAALEEHNTTYSNGVILHMCHTMLAGTTPARVTLLNQNIFLDH